jgi:hypothetical protein
VNYLVNLIFQQFSKNTCGIERGKNSSISIRNIDDYHKLIDLFKRSCKDSSNSFYKPIEKHLILTKEYLNYLSSKEEDRDLYFSKNWSSTLIFPEKGQFNSQTALGVFSKKEIYTAHYLLSHLSKLFETCQCLELWKKEENYQRSKKAFQGTYQSRFYAFNLNPYRALENDKKKLEELFTPFSQLKGCFHYYKKLLSKQECEGINLTKTREQLGDLYLGFERIFLMLSELYDTSCSDKHFLDCIKKLGKSIYCDLKPLSVKENSFNFTKIFKNMPSIMTQSSHKEDLEWKIEKYEIIFLNLSESIDRYLQGAGLPLMKKFIRQVKSYNQQENEWKKLLVPVFKTFSQCLMVERERLTVEYLNSLRKAYKEGFLIELRKAARWAEEHPDTEGAKHIDAICECLYTQTNLNGYCKNLGTTFARFGSWFKKGKTISKKYDVSAPHYYLIRDLETFAYLINEAPNSVKAPFLAKTAKSLVDHLGGLNESIPFDSNLANPIHVFMHIVIIKDGRVIKKIKDIAMGTQTIEYGGTKPAEIAPEFLAFQRHNQRNNKKYLYINHQDFRLHHRIQGDESIRCQLIHDVKKNPLLKKTYWAVTYTRNTSFYKQDETVYIPDAKTFKENLLSQFFDLDHKETGNYIPKELDEEVGLRNWAKNEMIPKTHAILFKDQENLTQKESKVWNQLIDIHLSLKLMVKLLVDAYTKRCKDGVDRGAAADALLFVYLAIVNYQENSSKAKDFLARMLLLRTLMVRKRGIKEEQFDVFMETAIFLLDYKELIRKLHEELFKGLTITVDLFLEQTNQNSIRDIKEMEQSLLSEFVVLPLVEVKA